MNEELLQRIKAACETNCDTHECEDLAVSAHQIDAATMNTILTNFFGTQQPSFKTFQASYISNALSGKNCNRFRVLITADQLAASSNSDITFNVQQREVNDYNTYYSLALFRGLLRICTPTEFAFSKARNQAGDTIAFKLIRNGQIVYMGDMSDQWP